MYKSAFCTHAESVHESGAGQTACSHATKHSFLLAKRVVSSTTRTLFHLRVTDVAVYASHVVYKNSMCMSRKGAWWCWGGVVKRT
jgi:hypothetical protein